MALSNLHTNWINGSYIADRDAEIKKLENPDLANGILTKLNAHADKVGNSIAVGYGYDLKKNLKTLKTDLKDYVTASSDLDKVYNLVNDYFNNGNPNKYADLDKLAAAINQYFDFGTETSASNLLAVTVGKFETKLDSYLGYAMPQSKERAALVSLSYNGGLGDNLKAAILDGNRTEAWFEIRYNTNSGKSKSQGIANRRYAESNLFGLYDAGTLSKDQEIDQSKEIIQMYTEHNAEILAYEGKYAPVSSIQNEIQRAKTFLITNFGQGKTIDEVIVGQGLKTASYEQITPADDIIMTIGNKNNLIFGEGGDDSIISGDGNDVIYGGKGDDFISGGKGNDYLDGGSGNDDYYFQSGDGSDKIIDTEGANRIIWIDANKMPHVMKTFYKSADAEWKSPDGTASVNKHSPYKIVLPDGSTIELGEDISSFGIHLLDTPATPITNNTIIGNELANTLYDTAGNDRIESGRGNDGIWAGNGGNNWILGGEGNDTIVSYDTSGADIIEGGSGVDVLYGGGGDDQIFGENKGEMDNLIAQGETAQSIMYHESCILHRASWKLRRAA